MSPESTSDIVAVTKVETTLPGGIQAALTVLPLTTPGAAGGLVVTLAMPAEISFESSTFSLTGEAGGSIELG